MTDTDSRAEYRTPHSNSPELRNCKSRIRSKLDSCSSSGLLSCMTFELRSDLPASSGAEYDPAIDEETASGGLRAGAAVAAWRDVFSLYLQRQMVHAGMLDDVTASEIFDNTKVAAI